MSVNKHRIRPSVLFDLDNGMCGNLIGRPQHAGSDQNPCPAARLHDVRRR